MSSSDELTPRLTEPEADVDEPRLIWGPQGGERIRLVLLARRGRRLYPQPEEVFLPAERPGAQTPRLLITSEAAGGLGYWLGSPGLRRMELHDAVFDGRNHAGNQPAQTLSAVDATLSSQPGILAPLVRVYHHVEVLDAAVREDALARLRAKLERDAAFSCLLAGEDPRLFDTGPFSSIEPHLDVFRTPWFHPNEVVVLADEWAKRLGVQSKASESRAVADACVAATGGQPLLVQHYLRAVYEAGQSPESAWEHVHDHPPAVVRHWQRRLAEVVDRSPTAKREANWFVGGGEDPVASGRFETWPLFLSGWLGLLGKGAGRTYRFSTLHQEWARPVLRSHTAYLERA